jgi:hypothetical protein
MVVNNHKLCFRCLTKNHFAKDCKVKFLCDINKCGKRHHRLLHTEEPEYMHAQDLPKEIDEKDHEPIHHDTNLKKGCQILCDYCQERGHFIYRCERFAGANLQHKLSVVKDKKLCFKCLSRKHRAKSCKMNFTCDVKNCGKRHHRLLHTDDPGKIYLLHLSYQGIASDIESDLDN